MWALNFLPDVVFHAIFILGILGLIAGFVLGFIPVINQYKFPIQLISILVFSLGLWYEGGIAKDQEWKAVVMDLTNKIALAEREGQQVTEQAVTKVITKDKIIFEKGATITEYVDREIIKYDKTCQLPEAVILAHNAAALNKTDLLPPLSITTELSTTEHNNLAKPGLKLAPRK